MISNNIENVLSNISAAAKRSAYKPETVLIAVSKTKPIEAIEEAYACGIRDFGENKVQELVEKYEHLPKDIRWHMIGHLQRNKVKYIVDKVYMIHSVDSLRLAQEISKEAVKKQVDVKILVEVNVAGEETKFGTTDSAECVTLVKQIAKLPNVVVKGLMTVAPFTENEENNRLFFAKLRQLAVDIKKENIDNICVDILSMGMSGDYEVAVEEGASYVRIGTGIFGERNYGQIE